MDIFEEQHEGAGRKGVAFVAKMMRKTKNQHGGEYRKPPARPFKYNVKDPENWSKFIQHHFGDEEPVPYKRPKKEPTEEDKKYNEVHKWEYWGLDKDDFKYDEKHRYWIDKDGITYPPFQWTNAHGDSWWGLRVKELPLKDANPEYAKQLARNHFKAMIFRWDDAPDDFDGFGAGWRDSPRTYLKKIKKGGVPLELTNLTRLHYRGKKEGNRGEWTGREENKDKVGLPDRGDLSLGGLRRRAEENYRIKPSSF